MADKTKEEAVVLFKLIHKMGEVQTTGWDLPNQHPLIEKIDQLYYDITDCLADIPFSLFDNDQDLFNQYLETTRTSSWDIASALSHNDFDTDIMYNPNGHLGHPPDKEDLEAIDHFREIHGLDLSDPRINWSFDT